MRDSLQMEYDIGYFEGIRAAFMAFTNRMNAHPTTHAGIDDFLQWIQDELEDARVIRDGHP